MVDVSAKPITARRAQASAVVRMQPSTQQLVRDRQLAKGDVLEVARLAAVTGAKQTANLIPLCHPLPLSGVQVAFSFPDDQRVRIEVETVVEAKTGVEMEALTAAAVAALTIYDMCKAVDRGMQIECIQLESKSGGRSGEFHRGE